jgi:3-dehydroquinate synthase
MSHMQTVTVDLGNRHYPIHIGSGLLHQTSLLTPHINGQQVMVVTNTTVAPLYLESVKKILSDYQISEVILPDGEQHKNLTTLNNIFDALLAGKHNRSTTLMALGGGVIGDMTGFAASCYQRGVNFIQIPTTLLSQVDSSVGGKTGVNHALGKNMIGAFYQPQCVVIDIDTLQTLPDREFSAGLTEVIKYGLIQDFSFFEYLESNIEKLVARNTDAIIYAVKRSCEIKADIVAQDEKESGVRALLNLGHTFGHAIETAQGYGNWLHGEAVGTGILMAAYLSHLTGRISKNDLSRIYRLLEKAKLPTHPPADITQAKWLELMSVDKKVQNGQLRLVLLNKIGAAHVTTDFDKNNLARTLTTIDFLNG